MTNPTVPREFTRVDHCPVTISKHCVIAAGAVILPGINLGAGCVGKWKE
jgi:acetyltransferase-like isoleucine patch superfamily enzyme